MNTNKIVSYKDLDVYQTAYQAMIKIHNEILSKLPSEERYDLKDQLRRSTKAIPRLIAEGHAKRHQKRGFQKYIDDAMAEANETTVSLEQSRDLYSAFVDTKMCNDLLNSYDKISRQLYKLAVAWDNLDHHRKTMDVSIDPTNHPSTIQ